MEILSLEQDHVYSWSWHDLTTNNSTKQKWQICSCLWSRTAWRNPQRSPCLPVWSQPLLHRWHLLQRDWPHSPQVPLSDAEEALSATRVLSDYTHEDLRAFFVQAFWLCHSAVTILLHLPASTVSFPHTPSQWKSLLASSFRVNRRESLRHHLGKWGPWISYRRQMARSLQ